MPASSVEKIGNITTRNSAQQIISNLAKSKNLSESMIAYRLHLLGRIDQKYTATYESTMKSDGANTSKAVRNSGKNQILGLLAMLFAGIGWVIRC